MGAQKSKKYSAYYDDHFGWIMTPQPQIRQKKPIIPKTRRKESVNQRYYYFFPFIIITYINDNQIILCNYLYIPIAGLRSSSSSTLVKLKSARQKIAYHFTLLRQFIDRSIDFLPGKVIDR